MVKIESISGTVTKFDMGNYYPSRTTKKTHHVSTENIIGISEILIGSEFGIRVDTINDINNFNLCFDNDFTNFEAVESVYGVTPTSHEHLLQLLIPLL